MKSKRYLGASVSCVSAAIALVAFSTPCLGDNRIIAPSEEQVRLLADVFNAVKASYVDAVDDKELMRRFLTAMITTLDPYSTYMSGDDFRALMIKTNLRQFGVEVAIDDDDLTVLSLIEDSSAALAGIQRGDRIVGINDLQSKGMTQAEVLKQLGVKPNGSLKLSMVRSGEAEPLTFTVERKEITSTTVKSRTLEPGYALIQVSQFQEDTAASLVKHLRELYRNESLKGLILDLRNNTGGLLHTGIAVAAAFLPQNAKVVSTRGRAGESNRDYLAQVVDYSRRWDSTNRTWEDPLAELPPQVKHVPMVVLVNGVSAAASEIVAGALQDHKRAIILGTPTYGKSTVQTVLPLRGDSALKLTTARWHTPNGRSVQSTGLLPDIVVEPGKTDAHVTGPIDDPQLSRALTTLKNPQTTSKP